MKKYGDSQEEAMPVYWFKNNLNHILQEAADGRDAYIKNERKGWVLLVTLVRIEERDSK